MPPLSRCLCVSVANPIVSYSCGLFGLFKKVKSFAIKQIQTLFCKTPGVEVPQHFRAELLPPSQCATWRLYPLCPHSIAHTCRRHGVYYPLRSLYSALRALCVTLFPSSSGSSMLTPLLLITSLQPQQFHTITHSFAQRESAIPSIFNSFHTLLMLIGGGTPFTLLALSLEGSVFR